MRLYVYEGRNIKTGGIMKVSYEILKRSVSRLNYKFFEGNNYDLNIIGIRSNDMKPDVFNDLICVAYKVAGSPMCESFVATTDPGLYWLNNPENIKGTAIVLPGQYPGLWTQGLHKGYPALVQVGKVTVIRDHDRDSEFDLTSGIIDTGIFGIDLHRALVGVKVAKVGKFSAGCQVVEEDKSLQRIRYLANLQIKNGGGKTFTYTLLTEKQLVL